MILFFEPNVAEGETLKDFTTRLNGEIDALRDANLVVNCAPFPGGSLVVWAQVGADEPIVNNGQLVGMRFKDLPTSEVTKKIEQRKAALARSPGRVITPER